MEDVGDVLLKLNESLPNQARNAFAACLLVPGFEGLRFHPLILKCKKQWNQSTPRYPKFWNGARVIKRLAVENISWENVEQVRDRLILVSRLIGLHRSIDLARMYRKISFIDGKPFIWVQRKGWPIPRWEQVVRVSNPLICPWTLLQQYVSLTHAQTAPGEPVFRHLKMPFLDLKSDSIGSITKKLLGKYGIHNSWWSAHSTRGAGVAMYKSLGLSSEEVCQIGQWKNTTAFANHYLRLNAQEEAGVKIASLVHSVSPMSEAEPERSIAPTMEETEGFDLKGDAQDSGEPNPPNQKRTRKNKGPRSPTPENDTPATPKKFAFKAPPPTASPKQ